MMLLLVSVILSINIPVIHSDECGPQARSADFCVTRCTNDPDTRDCELYGRKQPGKKILCSRKIYKNTYKNNCAKDPNWPPANPTAQCGLDTDDAKTTQQKPNPHAVRMKYCTVVADGTKALESILTTAGGAEKYCAQFVDEKSKKRKYLRAAYPGRPHFYQGMGWNVALCVGESGTETNTQAHREYVDVQSENIFDTDRSNAYAYTNGNVVVMVMVTFVLLCFICACMSVVGGFVVGASLFSWYPKATNNNVDIV